MLVLLWLVLVFNKSYTFAKNCNQEPRCKIFKVHGMKAADCFDKDFREFPSCIKTDIEVLDLTKNRIKQIRENDLEPFSSLQVLYLQDNLIVNIQKNAFNAMSALSTLDLSNNAINPIPDKIFHLPSLKTLYLGQNLNINIVEVIENNKPLTSPLVKLDISYNNIEELPDLGAMPYLIKYNISGMNLSTLKIRSFAGLCKLQQLITNELILELENPCECWDVNRWFAAKQKTINLFNCSLPESNCPINSFETDDLEMFQQCQLQVKEIGNKEVILKIVIPVVVVLILIVIILLCYFRRKRQKVKHLTEATKTLTGRIS